MLDLFFISYYSLGQKVALQYLVYGTKGRTFAEKKSKEKEITHRRRQYSFYVTPPHSPTNQRLLGSSLSFHPLSSKISHVSTVAPRSSSLHDDTLFVSV
jgi:hypothetical protein